MPDLEVTITRRVWLDELIRILRRLREGAYYVRRGPIAWTAFHWPKERAMAVRAAENFPKDERGLKRTTLEIVVMARMPDGDPSVPAPNPEVNDQLLDDMEDDVTLASMALMRATFEKDGVVNTMAAKVEFLGSIELSDDQLKLQGWAVTLSVEY